MHSQSDRRTPPNEAEGVGAPEGSDTGGDAGGIEGIGVSASRFQQGAVISGSSRSGHLYGLSEAQLGLAE